MPFSSDLFADNDALEPSRTPSIPVSERYSVGGYEVLSGRSGNFSCHTVLSGEVWKMGTEEKLALSGAVREVLSGYVGKAETVLAAGFTMRHRYHPSRSGSADKQCWTNPRLRSRTHIGGDQREDHALPGSIPRSSHRILL